MLEQLVLFTLNNETYGVDVGYVQSIIPMQNIVTVPGTRPFIKGVVNLRGTVVPVVDLRTRFKLPLPTNGHKSVIVVVELNSLQVGLLVDKVTAVVKIPETAIQPPSPLLTNVDTPYLRGIGHFEEQMIILMDLDRVFVLEEQ